MRLYQQASLAGRVGKGIPPLLLIYGAADEQVPVESADRLVLALGQAGITDVGYYRLARVGHCPHGMFQVVGSRADIRLWHNGRNELDQARVCRPRE